MEKKIRPFGMRDRLGYAMGDMGCGFSFQLVSTYMQLFYCQCIGIKLEHYAIIIIISKVWDAINDILIGNLVDTKRISKKSKYMPWIMIGAVALVACTILIFVPVMSLPYAGKVMWCLLGYCIWSVAYTMVNVPYGSLHSVITDNARERTSLSTFRSIGAGVAAMAVMILPKVVYKKNESGTDVLSANSLLIVAVIFSIFALASLFGTTRLVTERVVREEKESEESKKGFSVFAYSLKAFFTNRPMVGATIATIASVAFYNSTLSVNNLVFQYFFNDAGKASIASIAGYIPLVALMPFIGKITSKIGKKKLITIGSLVSVIASVFLMLMPIQPTGKGIIIYVCGLMFVNLGNCAFQITVWAIIADCIEMSYRKTGKSDEGSLYAIYSFFRKLSQGIGQAIVSLGLGIIGFVEGEGAVQPDGFGSRVKTLYIVFLLIGTLVTLLSMKFIYNIGKKEEDEFEKAVAEKYTEQFERLEEETDK
ncbi:MAG: MFS transporter [Acutalibacteraceae bacterium]